MCLAALLFTCMNTMVKFLSPHFSSIEIVWARTLGHFLFMLALFVPQHGFSIVRSTRPGTQLSRSLLSITSTTLYFTALRQVSLADATAIGFLSPVLVTLLAAPMLGERIRASHLLTVLVGFVGVLIVVQPGTEVFRWGSLLIVASSTCFAMYQVLTRRVAQSDPAETSAIYSALLGSVLMSLLVPLFWTTPASWWQVAMLLVLGLFGGLGHYFVACSMACAPANLMSPFQYLQLIGAVMFGYFVFGDVPTIYTWIGAALIMGCGLYLGWYQSRKAIG